MQKAPSQFTVAARAQASRDRNTSTARRQAAKLCLRFGPLTPSARSANLITRDGRRTAFPLRTKNCQQTKKHHLTGKAPYRFESLPSSAESAEGILLCNCGEDYPDKTVPLQDRSAPHQTQPTKPPDQGFSATIASVVTSRPAIEAAACSAKQTTLVGSMMPAFTMST